MTAIAPVEKSENTVRKILRYTLTRYSLVIIWILMVAVLVAVVPDGVSPIAALRAVLGQMSPIIFLGLAVVITMAVGEFDLSFAAIFGFSAVAVPSLTVLHGWPVWLAILTSLGMALTWGLINGLLIVNVGINSVVVTLGVSSVAAGLGFLLSQETTVSGIDPALAVVATGRFLDLPLLFWYGIVLVIIVAYIMQATPIGRNMLFVGSNPAVAKLAGISVTRVRLGAYLASAALCGLGGIILALGLGGFNPGTAATNLLPTFAAVFLGTVAVIPGRFNPIGMTIAAYFLLTGVFGLQLLGFTGWVVQVFYGVALVVAVTVSHILRKRIKS
jgi:ribose transport system permease protein